MELMKYINQAVEFLQPQINVTPKVGLILGTGLGDLAQTMEQTACVAYKDIPHFAQSTVESHEGDFLAGYLAGCPIVAMQGRFHFYEGYRLDQITFPVRVMKALGVDLLVVSNAAGGLNPLYKTGDLVIISDHINFMGVNPLVGSNDDRLGPRFPDMSDSYTKNCQDLACEVALTEGLEAHRGVYIGVTGPCLETAAEYRFMRAMGADVIGMSTVPEVIVAVHAGLKVLGISCVTDMCLPDALMPANVEEIIAVAQEAEPKMSRLVTSFLKRWTA